MLGAIRRIARRGTRAGKAVILLYHRVANAPFDPQLLCVTPENFGRHLECICHSYRPIPLHDLVEAAADGSIPDRSLAFTFDDGYADNLYAAKPLLERFGVPATVFVASSGLTGRQEFWWDVLERIFLHPRDLPAVLSIRLNGTGYERKVRAIQYGEDAYRRYRSWSVLEKDNPTDRHAIYRELCTALRPLKPEAIRKTIEGLSQWAGLEDTGESRAVSAVEMVELAAGGGIEIGSHAHSHALLSALPPADQSEEIRASKAKIEDALHHPISAFSYPFGSLSDYTQETISLVKTAGFRYACSTTHGPVVLGGDPFRLPRLIVRNWTAEELTRNLNSCARA